VSKEKGGAGSAQTVFNDANDVESYLKGKEKLNFDDSFKTDEGYVVHTYSDKEKSNSKLFAEKLKGEILQKWRCSDRDKFILFVVAVEKAFGYDVGLRASEGNGALAKYMYFNCIPPSFSFFFFFFHL
jgi:hypothetical protein